MPHSLFISFMASRAPIPSPSYTVYWCCQLSLCHRVVLSLLFLSRTTLAPMHHSIPEPSVKTFTSGLLFNIDSITSSRFVMISVDIARVQCMSNLTASMVSICSGVRLCRGVGWHLTHPCLMLQRLQVLDQWAPLPLCLFTCNSWNRADMTTTNAISATLNWWAP